MLSNIKPKNLGKICFRIGIFLLPSALSISVIFFLFSILINVKKNFKNLFKDSWNYPLFSAFFYMFVISIIHTFKYENQNYALGWDPTLSWLSLINWIPLFLVFVGVNHYLSTAEDRKLTAKLFLSGTVPILFSGFCQYWFNLHGPFEGLYGMIVWFQRPLDAHEGLSAVFNNANYAGSWFNIVWPFSLALFFEKTTTILKKGIIFSFGIAISTSIFLTSSRSAWGGFILSSFLLLGNGIFYIIIPFVFLSLIFSLSNIINFLPENFSLLNDFVPDKLNILNQFKPQNYENKLERIYIFKYSLEMISNKILLGWGASSFPAFYLMNNNIYLGHSHNLFLEIAFSYGIFPAILILITILLLLFKGFKILFLNQYLINSRKDYFEKAWFISFTVLFCSQMIDIHYFDGRISLAFWILFSGIRAIIYEEEKLQKDN